MNERVEDWTSSTNSVADSIKGLILLTGLGAFYFVVFSNAYFLAAFAAAIVLFSFGVVRFPRGADAKLADAKELERRVQELQSQGAKDTHAAQPRDAVESNDARMNRLQEQAQKDLKAERLEKTGFPWNKPWWGRVLCCVPFLAAGAFFFSNRL